VARENPEETSPGGLKIVLLHLSSLFFIFPLSPCPFPTKEKDKE
jgi:hypothetical protein